MPVQHCSKYGSHKGEYDVVYALKSLPGKKEKRLTITPMLSVMWQAISIPSFCFTANLSA